MSVMRAAGWAVRDQPAGGFVPQLGGSVRTSTRKPLTSTSQASGAVRASRCASGRGSKDLEAERLFVTADERGGSPARPFDELAAQARVFVVEMMYLAAGTQIGGGQFSPAADRCSWSDALGSWSSVGESASLPSPTKSNCRFRQIHNIMHDAPDDISWIAETRMLSICGLRRSTLQGWTKAGLLAATQGNAYGEGAVLEAALVAVVRDFYPLDDLAHRWSRLRREGRVDAFINRARQIEPGQRFDLVVEPDLGGITVVGDDTALLAAVRHETVPRAVVVIPLADRMSEVRRAFWDFAITGKQPTERKVGRPKRRSNLGRA